MNICFVIILMVVFIAFSPAKTLAETDQAEKASYKSDTLSFPINITGKYTHKDKSTTELCIPAKTRLRGLADEEDGSVQVKIANRVEAALDCETKDVLPDNVAITIDKGTLEKSAPTRFGLTYGGLVVPYKYHFSGSKSFSGGATVAPYFGYLWDKNSLGIAAKGILFLGPTKIDVVQKVNGEDKSQSLAGISYGVGVLGEVKGNFQLGVVLGADRVSSATTYDDNGKPWIAISIGFPFSKN